MKRYAAVLALAFVFACAKAEPPEPPEREATEILYVSAPKLAIHKTPDENSPVIATFNSGETISVLSTKGDWIEIRVNDGSGWSKRADLAPSANETRSTPDDPKFQTAPSPVANPTTSHGEIVLEASVDEKGAVTSVKTLSNTTGSALLAIQNTQQLAQARFYPMMQNGKIVPFVYTYRVTY